MLTGSAIQPLVGRLTDVFGRRRMWLSSLVFFLIGSCLCGASTDIIFLILARGFQGLGAGLPHSLLCLLLFKFKSLFCLHFLSGCLISCASVSILSLNHYFCSSFTLLLFVGFFVACYLIRSLLEVLSVQENEESSKH